MLGRTSVAALAISVIASPAAALAVEEERSEIVLRREDDTAEVVVAEDDGDDFTGDTGNSGQTSGVDSNDATGSGHTGVSRDRDRSVGDKTRDWTKDGSGDRKRDWSGGHTNDNSRHDTR
ncbi:MAG TPA: hypothetical protein VM784_05615 [Actinomycetota bacterium]|nr:hypothetical protein [Actinomycetota bacterium]